MLQFDAKSAQVLDNGYLCAVIQRRRLANISARIADEIGAEADLPDAVAAVFAQWHLAPDRQESYYLASCSAYLHREDRGPPAARNRTAARGFLRAPVPPARWPALSLRRARVRTAMRRAPFQAACALAAMLAAGPALAQDVVPGDFLLDIATPPGRGFDPVPPDDFLRDAEALADWIVANSRYNEKVSLPAFVLLPRATLNYIFYSQMVGGYQGQGCINALYVPHIMLLAEDFEFADCSDTLVHELVHHFQFVTGAAFRCTAEAEREAYDIQAQWTRETGVGVLPSPLFLRRLTCDNPHDWSR